MEKTQHIYQYEIEFLLLQANYQADREIRFLDLPDINAFLNRPFIQTVLLKVQEFIWTTKRLFRLSRQRTPKIKSVRPLLGVPSERSFPSIYLDVTAAESGRVCGGIKSVASALSRVGLANGMAMPIVMIDGLHITLWTVKSGLRPNLSGATLSSL